MNESINRVKTAAEKGIKNMGMSEGGTGCYTVRHDDPLGKLPPRIEHHLTPVMKYIWSSLSKRMGSQYAGSIITQLKRSEKKRTMVVTRNGVDVFIHVNKFDEWQRKKDLLNEQVNLTYF